MKNGLAIFFLSLISVNALCQPEKASNIIFSLNSDSVLKTGNGNLFEVFTIKYYISDVQLLNKCKTVFREKESYHLINLRDINACRFSLTHPAEIKFDQIMFNLGIDSLTSVSGAFGGDLDPVNGMYWTWQSGYINFKLEGNYKDPEGKMQQMEFHLGGYQYPFNALQSVTLPVTQHENMEIKLDLEKFFDGINANETNHIMSPGPSAKMLSEKLAECFTLN